jgi:hypothetical protein
MVICKKNNKKNKFFLKIKYDPRFILVTLKYNNVTANTSKLNSKSLKFQKSNVYKNCSSIPKSAIQMDNPGSKIAPRLEKSISSLEVTLCLLKD